MASIGINWDSTSTATSIASSAITNSSSATTSAAISNDGKAATEVAVSITYGETANEGAKVYLLRSADGTNFEAVADAPWQLEMPYTTSTTHRRTFAVAASMVSSFKVAVSNSSGASVTATVVYRQGTNDVT